MRHLNCPDCNKELRYDMNLSKFFRLAIYVCDHCDDWGVYVYGKLNWNFKVRI